MTSTKPPVICGVCGETCPKHKRRYCSQKCAVVAMKKQLEEHNRKRREDMFRDRGFCPHCNRPMPKRK